MFDVSCVAMRYVDLCYLFCVLCRCVASIYISTHIHIYIYRAMILRSAKAASPPKRAQPPSVPPPQRLLQAALRSAKAETSSASRPLPPPPPPAPQRRSDPALVGGNAPLDAEHMWLAASSFQFRSLKFRVSLK